MSDFKKSVVYQIYPKSFCDTSGNGQGDLQGVISKLDYLQNLGVDYIWLTPFYPSPQNDNGYDVADYCSVDSRYGSMADFEQLVRNASSVDIKIMMDMVFNHTSTEHTWFQQALAGNEKYMDYYIFHDSVDGAEPNNWQSKFGGSAWEYVPSLNKYYLHLFDRTQADLNWENPEVREEIYKAVNFWLDKGVKGLRLDVINLISKSDLCQNDHAGDGRRFYTDGPKVHEYLKELRERTYGRYDDVVTVGEMSSTTLEHCKRYSNPDEKELSMVFNFHHLKVDYAGGDKWTLQQPDYGELKRLFKYWQEGISEANGWSALFWCNHDQPRVVSRLGEEGEYRIKSAKMLATAIHMLRGTPYIYQGEEFGMTNAGFNSLDQYRDVESINHYQLLKDRGYSEEEVMKTLAERSRDNSRTPVQWDNSKNAGFTNGAPWLAVNPNSSYINAKEALEDQNSILHYYRQLIRLRKQYDVISEGEITFLEGLPEKVFGYQRAMDNTKLLVLCNFGTEVENTGIDWPASGEVIIGNYSNSHYQPNQNIILKPWECIAFLEI